MEWNSRASKTETVLGGLSRWTHWKTRDGKYRVSRRKWLGESKVSTVFYACVLRKCPTGKCWTVISKHRKKKTAVEACEKRNRREAREERKAAA